MTMPNIQLEVAAQQATAAITVGRMRGWPMPPAYATAIAVHEASAKIAVGPDPTLPATPTPATAVPGWIKAVAADRIQVREARVVAADLQRQATAAIVAAAKAANPDYVERLRVEFAEIAATFGRLAGSAPTQLTGYETPERAAAHGELLRTVGDLSQAGLDRGCLTVLSLEGASLGPAGAVWMFTDPRQPTSVDVDAVVALVQGFRSGLPSTLEQWTELHGVFGLSMAGVNEVSARQQLFNTAMQHRGQSDPSMGMAPMLWTDLVASTDARAGAERAMAR